MYRIVSYRTVPQQTVYRSKKKRTREKKIVNLNFLDRHEKISRIFPDFPDDLSRKKLKQKNFFQKIWIAIFPDFSYEISA